MIRGERKKELTINTVLNLISSYDIFRYYMPHRDWELNHAILSPFRKENSPSFCIGNKYGNLSFIDFGTGEHGDCFEFVKILYNLSSIEQVLKKIDVDFGLGFNSAEINYMNIVKEYSQPEELKKRYSLIQAVTRKFTKEELEYWKMYYQSLDDLRHDNIYSIKELYLNKRKYSITPNELRFGYLYGEGYWKIYFPFAEKKRKWLSNVPLVTLDGKENIQNCDVAFITKSKKDKMVLRKLYSCVTATQNESVGCFSNENVEFIKQNSNRQILMYDSDEAGIQSSLQITKLFKFDYCNVPKKYLEEGIKDFADLAKTHSLSTVEQVLKNKNLI